MRPTRSSQVGWGLGVGGWALGVGSRWLLIIVLPTSDYRLPSTVYRLLTASEVRAPLQTEPDAEAHRQGAKADAELDGALHRVIHPHQHPVAEVLDPKERVRSAEERHMTVLGNPVRQDHPHR